MGKKTDNNKEIPTITSLLNRKKLRVRSPSDLKATPEKSPVDLSSFEREFGEAPPPPAPPEKATIPPPVERSDMWDTRSIARAVKQIKASKTAEFKPVREDTTTRKRERSISFSMKRRPVTPPSQKGQGVIEVRQYSQSKSDISAPVPARPASPSAPHSSSSTVQASTRSYRPVARPPTTWTMEMLKDGPDPLGKGLAILMEKGAQSALFLAITPPPPGAKIPHFSASAAVRPTPDKLRLWAGLRWDPAAVPQVWNAILKSGYIEFQPPGAVTNAGSRRNTIRAAFGLGGDEILLLIRVGPVAACRGILAIYSDRSLMMGLGPILTLFNTPLPLQKAG